MQRATVVRVEDAAEMLLATSEAVLAELEAGRLRGFRIGGEWRTTEEAVMAFIEGGSGPGAGGQQAGSSGSAGLPARTDHAGPPRSYAPPQEWKPVPAFHYQWPSEGEEFHGGVAARVRFGQREVPLLIGFTDRKSTGRVRPRAVVFWGEPGATLYPMVEFVGANDFESTGRMASVIKEGSKHVKPDQQVPPPYQGFPLVVYSDVVTGPYAARSMAVEAHKHDYDLMARHAILRAQAKGWL
jgi:hypothetical protein